LFDGLRYLADAPKPGFISVAPMRFASMTTKSITIDLT
jgi:hypothetical protein